MRMATKGIAIVGSKEDTAAMLAKAGRKSTTEKEVQTRLLLTSFYTHLQTGEHG